MALCVVALLTVGSRASAFGALIPGVGPAAPDAGAFTTSNTAITEIDADCANPDYLNVANASTGQSVTLKSPITFPVTVFSMTPVQW